MKSKINRMVSVISAAALTLSLNTPLLTGAGFGEVDISDITGGEKGNYFSTSDFSLSLPSVKYSIGGNGPELALTAANAPLKSAVDLYGKADSLPESYSLADSGAITGVRNQGPYGSCWTHSSAASAESSVIDIDPTVDLSELHTAYFTYAGPEQLGYDSELTPWDIIDLGGGSDLVINLWAQWYGPVREEKMKYYDPYIFNDSAQLDALSTDADYHLRDAYLINYNSDKSNMDEVNSVIKQLVYEGEAVDVSFFADTGENYNYNYCTSNSNRPAKFANHAVTIVGWDDSIPRTKFKNNPSGNGGWLCKNSWGTSFGLDGFFWISYYDSTLCDFTAYYLDDKDNYSFNHQYDSFAHTQNMSAFDDGETNGVSYMADVFKADYSEVIKAVSTYISVPGTKVAVDIYTGLTDPAVPDSGTLASHTEGSVDITGYYTIPLTQSATVGMSEYYGVVVSLYNEDDPFVIPVESAMYIEDSSDGHITTISKYGSYEQIKYMTASGESFFSADGETWHDVTDEPFTYSDEEKQQLLDDIIDSLYYGLETTDTELLENAQELSEYYTDLFATGDLGVVLGNVSLKVFADPVGKPEFALMSGEYPEGTELNIFSDPGSEMYYFINDGAEEKYTGPLTIDQYMKTDAYVTGGSYAERTYDVTAAQFTDIYYDTQYGYSAHEMQRAERIDKSTYYIEMYPDQTRIRLYPIASADVTINSGAAKPFEFGEWLTLDYGVTEIKYNLTKPDAQSNEVTVRILRSPITVDIYNETVSYSGAESLRTIDGTVIPDGCNVGDFAGQTMYATVNGEEIPCTIPERNSIGILEVDTYTETLGYIPNDDARLLQYSVKEYPADDDFISADARLVEGSWINSGMAMNKAIRIIPGEKLTLRLMAGNGKFASVERTISIPEAPDAPEILPEFRSEGTNVILNDFEFQGMAAGYSYIGDMTDKAEMYGYKDTAAFLELLKRRLGTDDDDLARTTDPSLFDFEYTGKYGEKILVRKAPTSTAFASKAAEIQLWERGDVNMDGAVDGTDATLILKHYANYADTKIEVIPKENWYLADYNQDGAIDGSDATLVLKLYAQRSAYVPVVG